jgi:hypothetical protein
MPTRGVLLQFREKELIQYSLFSGEDETLVLSTITYEFEEKNGVMFLSAREELKYDTTVGERSGISLGWDAAVPGGCQPGVNWVAGLFTWIGRRQLYSFLKIL